MSIMRMLAGLLLATLLSACGGGGGSPGTTSTGTGGGDGTGAGTTTPAIAMALVDSNGAAVTSIDSSKSAFARATVRDGAGAPVAGVVVTFSADAALVSFVPSSGTALTDANGVASIQVTPANSSAAGATTVSANATVAGTAAKAGTLGVQVVGSQTADTPIPAAVELFASSGQVPSATGASVDFTVAVKDAQNRALPNQTVTFTASSGNLIGALPARSTGPSGQPVTGISLSAGGDRSNRDIVVTASAGTVRQTLTVVVTGTALSLTGESSVLLGATTSFVVTARDSIGAPVPGAALTATSSLGNTITPAQLVTDSLGSAKFTYRAANSGQDTVTVRGLGTSATASVAISPEDFAFEPPATSAPSIGMVPPLTVTVRLLSGGAPAAGRTVTFSTTRGSVSVASAVTDANGRASTSVSSTTAGPASIVARAGTSQALLPLTFAATTPDTLVLQANPGAVPPNAGGSTANQVTLQATVRDPVGNPVAGKIVNFTATQDLSNGTITPGSGVTDANGIVSVQFIPGALSTGNNGVAVTAAVQGTNVSGSTQLTVSTQALFISIGKGRLISELNEPVYKKQFSVYVTDANGAAVPNKQVTLSVLPDGYYKGFMILPADQVAPKWTRVVTAGQCANEDRDRDGILDAGEDSNANGKLDPGLPVVVTPASVTTDAGGFATFFLEYGKNFALWVDTTITARALVAGTESIQTQRWQLEVMEEDVSTAGGPPNTPSPFGMATSCSDPN